MISQYWVKWPVLFLFCLVHGDALSSVSPSEIRSLGSPRFLAFSSFILKKQTEILKSLEASDGSGAVFKRDPWKRDTDGSFGVTTCLEEGALVEKGAASVSVVHGVLTEVLSVVEKAMTCHRS